MKRQLGLSEMVRRRTARTARRATRGALGFWAWSNAGDLRRGRETHAERRRGRVTRTERGRGRRGSTLLIVMALLGMLTLLGMLYFTFASQEQANATYFADAVKRIDDPGDDIDAIFNAALKQLIQGADTTQPNSVLSYPKSLLGTYYGKDLHPFSGVGVNVVYKDAASGLIVDQDGDGTADSTVAGYNLLEPNDSMAAQLGPGGQPFFQRNFALLPAFDVDYTYPDINNMFLAYKAYVWDSNTVDPVTMMSKPSRKLVIKPSFHRPELFRDNAGNPITDWATASAGRARSFRPHPDHFYVWRQNTALAPEGRYLNDYNGADAAAIASLSCLRGFPFHNVPPLPGSVPGTPVPRTQGVWSQTGSGGPALPPAPIEYQYDSDNDADGFKEGVWIDLDLPVQVRSSDSKTYLPMISFTVYDLDALLNLNIHGNLSGDTKTGPTTNFGNNNDIHRSCMGLSPNEVNLLHALDAVPATDFAPTVFTPTSDYVKYYNHNPSGQRELANMELWWLLTGRMQWPAPPSTAPPQILAGRHGEANRLQRVLTTAGGSSVISVNQSGAQSDYFPFAGFTYSDEANRDGGDDNRDENEGRENWLGGMTAGMTQPFGHPLALNGRGRFWGLPGPGFKSYRNSPGGLTGNPTRWQSYDGMGVGYDAKNNLANAAWLDYLSGTLMTNTLVGANYKNQNPALGIDERMVHDTGEINLEPKSQLRPYDESFEAIESIWLHMGSGDRSATGLFSRAGNLMPSNFMNATLLDPNYSHEISQRFAADTWDVKQFALLNSPDPATVTTTQRTWEFNVDFDGDGRPEFPPQFNPTTNYQPAVFDPASGSYRPENAFGPRDPFRPQLRRLLTTEFGDTQEIRHPMKLSINEFLDVEHKPDVNGSAFTSPLQYRSLTPHITSVPTTPITSLPQPTAATSPGAFDPFYDLPPFPPAPYMTFTQDEVQEFWARRDRQQMARDIYVMLYTFCGGEDGDAATNAANTRPAEYTPQRLKQMAQIAVNLVDMLDRDDVITAFEYDTELSNGWGLDDDPFGPNGNDPQSGEKRIVYGVEAQQLTISEVHWMHQAGGTGSDHTLTPFDEMTNDFNFLHVELRSIAPKDIPLADAASTSANRGIWRLVRDDNQNADFDAAENAITILNGPPSMTPGSLFTIGNSDATGTGTGALYLDYDGTTPGAELVAPFKAGFPPMAFTPPLATAPATTPLGLDLLHASHTAWFALANGSPGDFLSRTNNPGAGATDVHVALQRRLNPYLIHLPPTLAGGNPFLTVDQFRAGTKRELKIDTLMVASPTDVGNRLNMTIYPGEPLQSKERGEPLRRNVADCNGTVGTSPLNSTMGANNSLAALPGGVFRTLHHHFDRDYSSVIDLFDLHLEAPGNQPGPADVTRMTSLKLHSPRTANNQVVSFGQAVLTSSEDLNGNGTLDSGEDFNGNMAIDRNHYHRLLSLVEVPTRTHRQLGDPLKVNRIPGKVNFNTLRDRHVLAAMIDDRDVVATEEDTNRDQILNGSEDSNGDGLLGMADQTGDTARDWWNSFLAARDGVDATTGLPLPISGISRPFRDLANLKPRSLTAGETALDDTILRRLPTSVSAAGRQLFVLADETEYTGNQIAPGIRHRLLSKMIGNTTTRSNVFVVFVTIGMFECYENPTTGAVRIGGQMDVNNDGSPDTHRAVFIIDRSAAEDAFDKGSGTFDWKKLVLAKQRVN